MSPSKKFTLLRKVLRGLGLSQDAVDDLIITIAGMLPGESGGKRTSAQTGQLPYHLRDNFLSPAELNFCKVLQGVIGDHAHLAMKVGLADIFYVQSSDHSRFRIYTNKIDRKHVDFLLCDPVTMQPLVAIELDDRSHQRPDRRERDKFVNEVFAVVGLPLLRVPVKRGYQTTVLAEALAPYLSEASERVVVEHRAAVRMTTEQSASVAAPLSEQARRGNVDEAASVGAGLLQDDGPSCPKCGSEMILRTAKKGANAGGQFWGCSKYPKCRGIVVIV